MDYLKYYFSQLTDDQLHTYRNLEACYQDWNAKINLISRKDIDSLLLKHILHSLAIAKFIEFPDGSKIMDVGTGGGFPGIPLAIMFPYATFHLVDSVGKKIKVVNDIIDKLGIKNVKTYNLRAENMQDSYDYVVSRAVANTRDFYQWVKKKFNKKNKHQLIDNGIFYLKGGDLTEELREANVRYKLFEISDYYQEEFFQTKKVLYIPHQ
ncbi:MAG TPA: 16S rRNA (guanine(527)-N(7))-methyltransferase RsmG [Cyclobacteriaceae bacterium]